LESTPTLAAVTQKCFFFGASESPNGRRIALQNRERRVCPNEQDLVVDCDGYSGAEDGAEISPRPLWCEFAISVGNIVPDTGAVQIGHTISRGPRTFRSAGMERPLSSVTSRVVSMRRAKLAPRLETDAVLIPLAFGLAGVNLHTGTGWGSVTHWKRLRCKPGDAWQGNVL
jgi:hypothetical protein